jgi:hypothetical protein
MDTTPPDNEDMEELGHQEEADSGADSDAEDVSWEAQKRRTERERARATEDVRDTG